MGRNTLVAQTIAIGAVTATLLVASSALAQSTESNNTPVGVRLGDASVATGAIDYVIPDLPPTKPPSAKAQERFFSIRPSLALLWDYTWFNQDAASIAQVGTQTDQSQVRSARLTFLGTIGHGYKVSYQVGGEYKGFDTEPETTWQLTDLSLTFPLGGPQNKLTVGKTKETFAYEMVGDAANLPQSERVLSPFFVSRNMGARMMHVIGADKRMTLSYGIFNDAWDINSSTSRGWDVSGRMTGLVWDHPDANQFLHLGVSFRHVASDGTMRYAGRPESNVSSNFVDTGKFSADSALHIGLEALFNSGPVSVLAEYNRAEVDSFAQQNPTFQGYYITGSWVLTGETRPYDRNVGYARRVIPTGRWGAPELVVRFSHVDLDDKAVHGGTFDKTLVGLNWWATRRWKFGASWGHTWLDKLGQTGEADSVLARVQWVY